MSEPIYHLDYLRNIAANNVPLWAWNFEHVRARAVFEKGQVWAKNKIKNWYGRSKYQPHQGKKERLRRTPPKAAQTAGIHASEGE